MQTFLKVGFLDDCNICVHRSHIIQLRGGEAGVVGVGVGEPARLHRLHPLRGAVGVGPVELVAISHSSSSSREGKTNALRTREGRTNAL